MRPGRRSFTYSPCNFADLPEEQDQVAWALVNVLYEKLNADRCSREAQRDTHQGMREQR
jgi:hypothetical protein